MEHFELISFYFHTGMNYNDILKALAARHGVVLSKRRLIRLLKRHNLNRKQYADLGDVIDFIVHQLDGPGRLLGYRWMYNKCLKKWHSCKKGRRPCDSALDPTASALGRSRRLNRRQYFAQGPNYIWHVDSYDKLKPYGIYINGCIDGFSRKIFLVFG